MVNSVVLIDPFDKGHHAHYASILAGGLGRLGWDIYVVGSELLIISVKKNCDVKGEYVLSLSDGAASEFDKYRYLCDGLKAASFFQAQRIHLLTLDRMIGALYLALFRFSHLKNLYATLHWGNMLIDEQKGWAPIVRSRALRFLLNRLVKTRLVLMLHSPALVARMSHAKSRVGYIPYPHDFELVTDADRVKGNEIRERALLPDTAIVLLCFGETRRDKGADVAVRVLAHLPEVYYLFVVGSEGEITGNELVKIAAEKGVSSRIRLNLSFVPDDEVMSYFLAADVVLLPYHKSFSGQSGPLVTALALGLPVLVSPALVFKETVNESVFGVVAENDDEESIAVAIRLLLTIVESRSHQKNEFMRNHSGESFVAHVEKMYYL